MASRLSVTNDALGHLGEERTESLDDTQLRSAARKVVAWLDRARDRVLVAQDWLDARTYLTLQPSGVAGNFKYSDTYLMPAGCLMVRDVAGCAAWERGTDRDPATGVEVKVIRASAGGAALDVTYTRRIDWTVVPEFLETALGLQTAALACFGVNGDGVKAKALQDAATVEILAALGKDGVQMGNQGAVIPDPYGALRRSAL